MCPGQFIGFSRYSASSSLHGVEHVLASSSLRAGGVKELPPCHVRRVDKRVSAPDVLFAHPVFHSLRMIPPWDARKFSSRPGEILDRKQMEDWMREEYIRRGYSLVYTPHVARRQLFHTSGHEGYYSQNMFDAMELDDAEYRLKPMNCPGHILIYKDSLKSLSRFAGAAGELGTVYRYERSGVMHGLLRVRGFTQDDAHIFCTPEQIESEIAGCLDFALDVLKDFGFDKFPKPSFHLES